MLIYPRLLILCLTFTVRRLKWGEYQSWFSPRVRVANVWIPRARDFNSGLMHLGEEQPILTRHESHWITTRQFLLELFSSLELLTDLTSSIKPGVPPREMMKELRTDKARKYGKTLSQLSLCGHLPRVAVKLSDLICETPTHLQLSNV